MPGMMRIEPSRPRAPVARTTAPAAAPGPRDTRAEPHPSWVEAVPLVGVALTRTPQDEQLHAGMENLVGRSLSGSESRVLLRAARRLGPDAVQRLQEGGIRLALLQDSFLDARSSLSAIYHPDRKTVEIGSQRLSVDTVVHELGHALDDLAAPDGAEPVLKSSGDPHLKALYEAYRERVEEAPGWQRDLDRGPVWSDYAATNVHEYLAEGVMKYCAGSRRLREQDPALHEYVRDLVG